MKLHELKLFEEPIPSTTAEQLWQENGEGSAQFISKSIFLARPSEEKEGEYEVYSEQGNKRKLYGVLSEEDFESAFTQLRPNEKPDVEGFLTYRFADVYDAFKYGGDTIKVTLSDGVVEKLSKGDYLLRQESGDEFIYTIEKANYFDNNYMKKV